MSPRNGILATNENIKDLADSVENCKTQTQFKTQMSGQFNVGIVEGATSFSIDGLRNLAAILKWLEPALAQLYEPFRRDGSCRRAKLCCRQTTRFFTAHEQTHLE